MARIAHLVASDPHYGDAGQYYRSLQECIGRATTLIRDWQPDETELILVGDLVAGRGIFRAQEMQNAIQLGSEQVWFAARDVRNWQRELQAKRIVVIRGNHDNAHHEDLAASAVRIMRLLELPAYYAGITYVGNFSGEAQRRDFWFNASHGFGSSSYYANSYSLIRDAMKAAIESVKIDDIPLRRFMRAHVHWLNVGQPVAYGCAIDTTGGWHRNERMNLGTSIRDTGVMVYLYDDSKVGDAQLEVKPVRADEKLIVEETRDVAQHYQVMAVAAAALGEMIAWAKEKGLAG